jgi:hypothetical protein
MGNERKQINSTDAPAKCFRDELWVYGPYSTMNGLLFFFYYIVILFLFKFRYILKKDHRVSLLLFWGGRFLHFISPLFDKCTEIIRKSSLVFYYYYYYYYYIYYLSFVFVCFVCFVLDGGVKV